MSHTVTFGERLKEVRTARGFTQQYVADQLHVSRVAYGYYENGTRLMRENDVAAVCKLLGISADYLLGLSDTKNIKYAEIAQTTGLTEAAIDCLQHPGFSHRKLVNHLLEEEPTLRPWPIDPEEEAFQNSPEQIEKAYQDHLKALRWEVEMGKKSILEHVAGDWARQDHEQAKTAEDYIAEAEAWARENEAKQITDYPLFDLDYVSQEEYESIEEKLRKQEQAEAKKSNLLSAIEEYVAYTSGCTVESMLWSEELTDLHSLRIGIGRGNSITFPSKEADELLEFMLLQNVITALKTFKQNCYAEEVDK